MNDTYTSATGTVLPKTLRQAHSFSILLGFFLMIAFPCFMVYCAIATESTFWGCVSMAILWFVAFALILIKALQHKPFAQMTFSYSENNITNQTPLGTNSIDLNETFYRAETTIPFYLGKGKNEVSYIVYMKTEETLSTSTGYYGLKALKQFHKAGAVLVPKEVLTK